MGLDVEKYKRVSPNAFDPTQCEEKDAPAALLNSVQNQPFTAWRLKRKTHDSNPTLLTDVVHLQVSSSPVVLAPFPSHTAFSAMAPSGGNFACPSTMLPTEASVEGLTQQQLNGAELELQPTSSNLGENNDPNCCIWEQVVVCSNSFETRHLTAIKAST